MEIQVIRKFKKDTYCIGEMLVNGKHFCDTIEDCDRGLRQDMSLSQLKKMKKYGITAIPSGTYNVVVYFWPKYRKKYPLLQNVPAYTGVLIHGLTNASQSLGCIGVGENKIKGGLINSEKYVRELTKMCEEAIQSGEQVTITIYS